MKLENQIREVMRFKHYSLRTEEAYVGCLQTKRQAPRIWRIQRILKTIHAEAERFGLFTLSDSSDSQDLCFGVPNNRHCRRFSRLVRITHGGRLARRCERVKCGARVGRPGDHKTAPSTRDGAVSGHQDKTDGSPIKELAE